MENADNSSSNKPSLPLAPPAIANWSIKHGIMQRGQRFPSHNVFEVINDRCQVILESMSFDSLRATFCSLEATTVNATLEYIGTLMNLSTELSANMGDDENTEELWSQVVTLMTESDHLQSFTKKFSILWKERELKTNNQMLNRLRMLLAEYLETLDDLIVRRDSIIAKHHEFLVSNKP